MSVNDKLSQYRQQLEAWKKEGYEVGDIETRLNQFEAERKIRRKSVQIGVFITALSIIGIIAIIIHIEGSFSVSIIEKSFSNFNITSVLLSFLILIPIGLGISAILIYRAYQINSNRFKSGKSFLEWQKYEEAIRSLESCGNLGIDRDQKEFLLIRAHYGKYFSEGEKYFNDHQWELAYHSYDKARSTLTNPEIIKKMISMEDKILDIVDRYRAQQEYEKAMNLLEITKKVTVSPDKIEQLNNQIQYESVLSRIDDEIKNNNYDIAITNLEDFIGKNIKSKYSDMAKSEIRKIKEVGYKSRLNEANTNYDQKDYQNALIAINNALKYNPNDSNALGVKKQIGFQHLKIAEEALDKEKFHEVYMIATQYKDDNDFQSLLLSARSKWQENIPKLHSVGERPIILRCEVCGDPCWNVVNTLTDKVINDTFSVFNAHFEQCRLCGRWVQVKKSKFSSHPYNKCWSYEMACCKKCAESIPKEMIFQERIVESNEKERLINKLGILLWYVLANKLFSEGKQFEAQAAKERGDRIFIAKQNKRK